MKTLSISPTGPYKTNPNMLLQGQLPEVVKEEVEKALGNGGVDEVVLDLAGKYTNPWDMDQERLDRAAYGIPMSSNAPYHDASLARMGEYLAEKRIPYQIIFQ